MTSQFNSQRRYSLRKAKYGAVSVAIAFCFSFAGPVAADDPVPAVPTVTEISSNQGPVTSPSSTQATQPAASVVAPVSPQASESLPPNAAKANLAIPASTPVTESTAVPASSEQVVAGTEATSSPSTETAFAVPVTSVAKEAPVAPEGAPAIPEGANYQVVDTNPVGIANKEIEQELSLPTVPIESAQPGDVISIDYENSPALDTDVTTPTATGSKQVQTDSATLVTTRIAAPDAQIGKQEPQVKVLDYTESGEDEQNTYQKFVRCISTKTVEVVKGAGSDVVETVGADIVFVIDHTVSMETGIGGVKNNITNFVKELAKKNIQVRLGLVDYSDSATVNYADFNGSKFTTDTTAFIAALEAIVLKGGIESPTVPLTKITDAGFYSWEKGNKRFAILVTDEDYDFDSTTPTEEATIQALNAAKISTTVISLSNLQGVFNSLVAGTGGLFLDINSDFADTLSTSVSQWIVNKVYEGPLLEKTVVKYEHYTEIVTNSKTAHPVHEPLDLPASDNEQKDMKKPKPLAAHPVKESVLPATGESSSSILSILGIGLVSFLGLVGVKFGRKHSS